MKDENVVIILLLIIILVLSGVLAIKIYAVKPAQESMSYAENKAVETKNNIENDNEKQKIQRAASAARVGDTQIEDLTYEKFDKRLKKQFENVEYTLSGPDSSGIFTLKIEDRTYNIDKNGRIL